jgi:hypothetical protein
MSRWLNEVKSYYAGGELDPDRRKRIADDERKWLYGAYNLALCQAPEALPPWERGHNDAPILRPLFKYVVRPGTPISKDVIAVDLDGDELKVAVEGLPNGARFDADARRITWTPGPGDLGVHVVRVTVGDGQAETSRPFPIIVKEQLGKGPVPPAPAELTAATIEDGRAVELGWRPPAGAANVAAYVIYRDGALWAVTDGRTLSFVDRSFIEPRSRTRYHVACYTADGAESGATEARPAIVDISPRE